MAALVGLFFLPSANIEAGVAVGSSGTPGALAATTAFDVTLSVPAGSLTVSYPAVYSDEDGDLYIDYETLTATTAGGSMANTPGYRLLYSDYWDAATPYAASVQKETARFSGSHNYSSTPVRWNTQNWVGDDDQDLFYFGRTNRSVGAPPAPRIYSPWRGGPRTTIPQYGPLAIDAPEGCWTLAFQFTVRSWGERGAVRATFAAAADSATAAAPSKFGSGLAFPLGGMRTALANFSSTTYDDDPFWRDWATAAAAAARQALSGVVATVTPSNPAFD